MDFILKVARGAISSNCYELEIDIIESTITTITCIEHLFYKKTGVYLTAAFTPFEKLRGLEALYFTIPPLAGSDEIEIV